MGKKLYSHLLGVSITTFFETFIYFMHRKEEFKKGPKVYQRRLEEIEEKAYTREQKVEIIRSL